MNNAARVCSIIHITMDHPDPLVPRKTNAISALLGAVPQYDHVVYSLNRVTAFGGVEALRFGERNTAIVYGALPRGIMLSRSSRRVAEWIIADLQGRRIAPAAVHSHKLTLDSLVAAPIARAANVPLLCSVQAKTDVAVLRSRPDLRARFCEIWQSACHTFPFSPRALATAEELLGRRHLPTTLLPCMTDQDTLRTSEPTGPRLLSIFNLDLYRLKNAEVLISAVMAASLRHPHVTLDIFGGGSPKSFLDLSTIIARLGAKGRVRLRGPLPHGCVQETIAGFAAMVMPTTRESYGMVFAEALFSGVPILHTRNWGIHGYLPDSKIGVACANPSSVAEVADGLCHLIENEVVLKREIAGLQRAGTLDFMRRSHIAATYRNSLQAIGLMPKGATADEQCREDKSKDTDGRSKSGANNSAASAF